MTIPKMIPTLFDESVEAVEVSEPEADPLITKPSIVSVPEFIALVSPLATSLTPLGSSNDKDASILIDPLVILLKIHCLLPKAFPGLKRMTFLTNHKIKLS